MIDITKIIQQDDSLFININSDLMLPFGIEYKLIDRLSFETLFVPYIDNNDLSFRMSFGLTYYTQSFTGLFLSYYPIYDFNFNSILKENEITLNMAMDVGFNLRLSDFIYISPYFRFPIFNIEGNVYPLLDAGIKLGLIF